MLQSDSLVFPISDYPSPGSLIQVTDGVYWIRMPLPFALDHINLWILDDGDGWVLVDSGMHTEKTKGLWRSLFDGPLNSKPPKKLLCTHFHPDHMGLSGWLVESFGLSFMTTEAEWQFARRYWHGRENIEKIYQKFMKQQGFMRKTESEDNESSDNGKKVNMSSVPGSFEALTEHQLVQIGNDRWKVIVGQGHSPCMATLYCEELNLLISGDQILPEISPNVSVNPFDINGDPLDLYLSSLRKFLELPHDVLVLPSHKLPFIGLSSRVEALINHHHERLDCLRLSCVNKTTAFEHTKVLFPRPLDDHQIMFAIGETVAHLNHLMGLGEVKRNIGSDGVFHYWI